jgi:hypothetical protein
MNNIEPSVPSSILPFCKDPPLRSYLYNAYVTGILCSADNDISPYCFHYQDLFLPQEKLESGGSALHVRFVPEMTFWQAEQIGYISSSEWRDIDKYGDKLAPFCMRIVNAILGGAYVTLFVNEYYIPGTAAYQKFDFRHELILVGTCGARNVFLAYSYDADGQFAQILVPPPLLHQAVFCTRDYTAGRYCCRLFGSELRRGPAPPRVLTKSDMAKSLEASFGSKGFGIYDYFASYFNVVHMRGEPVDLRATRVLWEQKSMHLLAVRSFVEDAENESLNGCSLLVDLARRIHLTAYAYSEKKSKADIETAIQLLAEARSLHSRIAYRLSWDMT